MLFLMAQVRFEKKKKRRRMKMLILGWQTFLFYFFHWGRNPHHPLSPLPFLFLHIRRWRSNLVDEPELRKNLKTSPPKKTKKKPSKKTPPPFPDLHLHLQRHATITTNQSIINRKTRDPFLTPHLSLSLPFKFTFFFSCFSFLKPIQNYTPGFFFDGPS